MDVLDAAREETQVLIADISHDLKTPLAVIGGYARAFEDGHVPEVKRQTYLHAIYEKSQAANDLLDSLLTISRLDHPSLEPDLVTCNLCEQVRLSAIAADAEVSQAKDTLEVDIADVPLWVDLDKVLFARVLGNLISNACRHNKPGTSIIVQCHQSKGHAMVSVLDDGAGFLLQLRDSASGNIPSYLEWYNNAVDVLELVGQEIDEAALSEVRQSALEDDPAYVLFTSGNHRAARVVHRCVRGGRHDVRLHTHGVT